jgi:peroxiredoxin
MNNTKHARQKKSLGKLALLLVGIALLIALFFMLGNKSQAPDVRIITIDGKSMHLSDLKGKMVLVDFWATDCPGCIIEMPKFVETYKQYHNQGFELVAVAMTYDPPEQVMHYLEKAGLPFIVAHDTTGEISTGFGEITLTPTAFLIDKNGKIIRKVIGDMDFASLHHILDTQLLGKS